ncbi:MULTISPECIES: DUF305 domain-containing protein [Nocardiaceae]|jgi:uncharacterized protein (DUF305 family)|uniref:DUF305 domain-containing protein n=1 Tax=Nocardiaceae TaxID=85025 RepID=UPI001E5A63EA|nr:MULTISPECIES: DUF305 domain-containing protein [Rhodococcus]MCC8929839.1 DUF305 domain-containing protein [Rhodococcus sp. I2R]MCZ4277172.1 DUF305 domain-containing protein [Rhodococcus yunnanensis]
MTAESTEPARLRRVGGGQRAALLLLGLVAALAIGFALGFLARTTTIGGNDAVPAADSVDVGFAQDMSVHHNQAIDMSAIALTSASDPLVRNLAFDMLTSQQNQVGQMQGWLAIWDRAPVGADGYMGWMTGSDHSHAMTDGDMTDGDMTDGGGSVSAMPGMASSDDLTALRQATGTDVDVLFLQLMLRHHEGGLSMMEYAIDNADTPALARLAESMVSTQESESTLMTQMLAARGAEPLPFP